jgi:membrane fusion protein (multidrug efflux system)
VKATLDNPDGVLRPGLYARADLGVAQRRGVLLVPEEAVLQRAYGSVIFALVDGNRVERRVVKTGGFHEGRIEIVEGAAAGEIVVVRGHAALVDGAVVRVTEPPGTAEAGLASRANALARGAL